MQDLLRDIGLPAAWVIAISAVLWGIGQVWSITRDRRLKLAEELQKKMLDELDKQLEEFYLPLRERFAVTNHIYQISKTLFQEHGKYVNRRAKVVSRNPHALRHIIVRGVFLPLNDEIRRIILEKQHFRHPQDKTDYRILLQHILLWSAFESAMTSGQIKQYDGQAFLSFPAREVKKQAAACDYILSERSRIRAKIIKLRESRQPLERRLYYAKAQPKPLAERPQGQVEQL